MPDITLMIELADFYDVDIRELLSGERKSEKMDKDLKETLVMVADYTDFELQKDHPAVYAVCDPVYSALSLMSNAKTLQ